MCVHDYCQLLLLWRLNNTLHPNSSRMLFLHFNPVQWTNTDKSLFFCVFFLTLTDVPRDHFQSHMDPDGSVLTSAHWGSLESDRSKHRWSAITGCDNRRCFPWEIFEGLHTNLGSDWILDAAVFLHWLPLYVFLMHYHLLGFIHRHERINTRKTLIIESCPDDDLVNLEFLDEVRFKVLSHHALIHPRYNVLDAMFSLPHLCYCGTVRYCLHPVLPGIVLPYCPTGGRGCFLWLACFIALSAGDNNQPPP